MRHRNCLPGHGHDVSGDGDGNNSQGGSLGKPDEERDGHIHRSDNRPEKTPQSYNREPSIALSSNERQIGRGERTSHGN